MIVFVWVHKRAGRWLFNETGERSMCCVYAGGLALECNAWKQLLREVSTASSPLGFEVGVVRICMA